MTRLDALRRLLAQTDADDAKRTNRYVQPGSDARKLAIVKRRIIRLTEQKQAS